MKEVYLVVGKLLLSLCLFILLSCEGENVVGSGSNLELPLLVNEIAADQAEIKASEIRNSVPVILADGLTLKLWASDRLAPDPIAMSIDANGNIYLTRTIRQNNSEFDIRGFRKWEIPSISFQSVEDRRGFLEQAFATANSIENDWLKDLNLDGMHDWKDLTIEKEEVWKLEDQDNDGLAEVSTRILSDFNLIESDVAGALLVRENDMFIGVAPNMWRLSDSNQDGVVDTKKSISYGYGVHIGFSGHNMSGLIEGPDGKIYWGIGDIGAHITALDGTKYKYPNQGVIVRSNPDGDNFEVFAHGLRNTHEFVFDQYGNMISVDNDGDHDGESERLVHIVEGSDAGWRTNWQFGKYKDPKNNTYNVWMDEKMYQPRWEGQAAYFIPPIINYRNGPTGMVYNPGAVLSSKWENRFFVVEFTGDASRSHIWGFTLTGKGASFELVNEVDVLSGILPTGIKFGPDGALYIADWIHGWSTKDYGRVWKLDVTDEENDLKAIRAETAQLMKLEFKSQQSKSLLKFISHTDMRIRQKAQFELVNRGNEGVKLFKHVLINSDNQLARIHAIWGIGQLAHSDKSNADVLLSLLVDSDAEVIAQAAKVIGDLRYKSAVEKLIPLLKHINLRVRFFAAQALGRIADKKAVKPLLALLEENNDKDIYIRHAGVLALARIGEVSPVLDLVNHKNRALRVAAVLVLRKLQNEKIVQFLDDADEYIVAEAARAINDDWSIVNALAKLANIISNERFSSEALLRRAINACVRVGGEQELDLLIKFASRESASKSLRAEALAAIANWNEPSVLDRVDGRYRGKIKRSENRLPEKLKPHLPALLKDNDAELLKSVALVLSNLNIRDYNDELVKLLSSHPAAEVRVVMLEALYELRIVNIQSIVQSSIQDDHPDVRSKAISYIRVLDIDEKNLPVYVWPIFENGSVQEQQEIIRVLGAMPIDKTESILNSLIQKMMANKLPDAVRLELKESVKLSKSQVLIDKVALLSKNQGLDEIYKEALFGGNARKGRSVYRYNSSAQCVRCHAINGSGGNVGPELTLIGDELSRKELLEALIEPNKKIATAYGGITLILDDGATVAGVLLKEDQHQLLLKTAEAEPLEISQSRIQKRIVAPSGMPNMSGLLSKRELRDLVEYLSSLKGD